MESEARPDPAEYPNLYECEACSAKSGAPTLCNGCLVTREMAGKKWIGPRWLYQPQQAKSGGGFLTPEARTKMARYLDYAHAVVWHMTEFKGQTREQILDNVWVQSIACLFRACTEEHRGG